MSLVPRWHTQLSHLGPEKDRKKKLVRCCGMWVLTCNKWQEAEQEQEETHNTTQTYCSQEQLWARDGTATPDWRTDTIWLSLSLQRCGFGVDETYRVSSSMSCVWSGGKNFTTKRRMVFLGPGRREMTGYDHLVRMAWLILSGKITDWMVAAILTSDLLQRGLQ